MKGVQINQCTQALCYYFNKSFNRKNRSSVAESPETPTWHCGQGLDISRSSPSLQRILKEDQNLHAYKVQLAQELTPNDHVKRRKFVECIIEHQQEDADFSNIIFRDETHFLLDSLINRQNYCIQGSENPLFGPVFGWRHNRYILLRKCGQPSY